MAYLSWSLTFYYLLSCTVGVSSLCLITMDPLYPSYPMWKWILPINWQIRQILLTSLHSKPKTSLKMSIYARVLYHVAHDKVGKQDNKKYSVQFSSCDTHIWKPKDNLCCCRFCAKKLGSKIIRYTVLYLTSLFFFFLIKIFDLTCERTSFLGVWNWTQTNLDSLEMNFILRLINYGIWFLYI